MAEPTVATMESTCEGDRPDDRADRCHGPESPSSKSASDENLLQRYITLRALHEALKNSSDAKIKEMESVVIEANEKYNTCKTTLEETVNRINQLENETFVTRSDLKAANENLLIQKDDALNFRLQRDSAVEVRNSLSNMVETRNIEIECLKSTIENLRSQLEIAVNIRCESLTKSKLLESKALLSNFKDKHVDQEIAGQNNQIDILKNELNRCSMDLHTVKTDFASMKVDFERQLSKKIDEINIANSKIAKLDETKETLNKKIDVMNKMIYENQEKEEKLHEDYKAELITKMKVIDIYKAAQEESNNKNQFLTDTVAELRKLLNDSTERNEELENKLKNIESQHAAESEEKNSLIKDLKCELENANELLQVVDGDYNTSTLEDISPTANLASKFLKSKMSITQAYDQLVRLNQELALKKHENNTISQEMRTIIIELEEKASFINQQQVLHEETLESNSILKERLESVIAESSKFRDENIELSNSYKHLQKENSKLKEEMEDLSRQLCFLLKDIDVKKNRFYNNDDKFNITLNGSQEMSASYMINKSLVTFSDIQELQSNNQKLLRLVKDLSEKKEKNEQLNEQNDEKEQQARLESLKNRVTELTAAQDRQVKMITSLVKQLDTYKKMSDHNTSKHGDDYSLSLDKSNNSDANITDRLDLSKAVNSKIQCLELLESQLNDAKAELNHEREKHRNFVEKSKKNEIKLIESNDSIHKQLIELQYKHIKALSSLESINEKVKALQSELETYKKETSSLNEKIKAYASLTGRQESTIKKIQDDLNNSRNKLAKAESLINSLQVEYNNSLKERSLLDESYNQNENCSFALKNIESIKQALLGDNNSIEKLHSSMEEANRTCTTLRCMLQEEQDKYNNIASRLQHEIEHYKTKFANEHCVVEKLQKELERAQAEIQTKTTMLEHAKNNTSYHSELNTNSYVLEAVKNKENQISEYKSQISTLKEQIEVSKGYIEKYSKIYECSENELKVVSENFNKYKNESENKMLQIIESEKLLKNKCDSLQEDLNVHSKKLAETTDEVNRLLMEVKNKNSEIEKLTSDLNALSENLQITEDKYGREIILHSKHIQEKTELKNELLVAQQQLNNVTKSKIELESILKENDLKWESKENLLTSENNDLKTQLQDITAQNNILHGQVDKFAEAISSLQKQNNTENNDSMNVEMDVNVSLSDSDPKSYEQLVNMIKYLRKEKEVLLAKFEIMQTENMRIKTQLQLTESQLDEAKLSYSDDKLKSNTVSSKHSGIIRKLEELNAISDCYSTMRKERDELLNKISELSESHKALQDTLMPLQENNRELIAKVDLLKSESGNYKKEAEKWKIRVNTLIERDGQNYPEDWKKIQNEYENLNKLLSSEKDNLKKATDEAERLKTENLLMEEQIEKLKKQNAFLTESFKKKAGELSLTKKENEKFQTELASTKNLLTQKINEHNQVTEKLTANETTLADIRNKEFQIRKIAKRYKTQYEELMKTAEEDKQKSASEAAAASENRLEIMQKTSDLEKSHSEKLLELNTQISNYSKEIKKLQTEIDGLKSNLQDKEESSKQILKTARLKMNQMAESKEALAKELKEYKGQVDLFEQNKDESDMKLQVFKSQYEGRLVKMEKEKNQLLQEKQNEITQLNRQIESLMLKVNQMQRKVDSHQSPKPSTSSNQGDKPNTEPPTANIKPMAGVASPRDGNRRVAGETPLASIKPMASHTGVRTAAVLPTTAQVQAHGIVHHQAPHTTGNVPGDMMSSSPSSSHHATEFMPSSSSVGARMHQTLSRHMTVPPPESTQDMDVELNEDNEISAGAVQITPQSATPSQVGPQQAVALVMPRMESTTESQAAHLHQQQASSSSGSNSSSTVTTSHGPSNSGATGANKGEIIRAFKRPRMGPAQPQQKTILKRTKTTQGFQRVTESEADYQVPTSSQRDQEDDVTFPDSEDEETFQERVYDMEEENDVEDDKENSRELRIVEEADVSENREVSRNNEAEFANSQDAQNSRSEEGNNRISNVDAHTLERPALSNLLSSSQLQEQQIETISSGNGIDSGIFMIGAGSSSGVTSAVVTGAYEDGDDSIVPSTPTLYVPARNDGFGEAVRSPMSSRGLSSNEGRFTFNESSTGTTGGVIEDTHADLAPQLTPHNQTVNEESNVASGEDNIATLESSEAEVDGCVSDLNTVDDEAPTVSSQSFNLVVEESREAEASTTAVVNTPTRVWQGYRGMKPTRRGVSSHIGTPRPNDHQRPSPIVWNTDGDYRRGNFNQQRGTQRGTRHIRRPPTFFKRFQ